MYPPVVSQKSRKPAWSRGRYLLPAVSVFLLIGILALAFLPQFLSTWWSGSSFSEGLTDGDTPSAVSPASAAQIVILALGGVVGIIGVALSMSRHGEEQLTAARNSESAARDQKRLEAERVTELRSRFVTLVDLLSDEERPLSRIAAIHGLGALADDWALFARNDEANVCANIIAEYLRSPPSDPSDTDAEINIRTTAFSVIGEHLKKDAICSWGGFRISLAGADIFFDADLSGMTLTDSGRFDLSNATISSNGRLRLIDTTIVGEALLSLLGVNVRDGAMLHMLDTTVSDRGCLDLATATISDHGTLALVHTAISARGKLDLDHVTVGDHGKFRVSATIRDHGRLDLGGAVIKDYGVLQLSPVTISNNGNVYAGKARVSGNGTMDLHKMTVNNPATLDTSGIRLEDDGSFLAPTPR